METEFISGMKSLSKIAKAKKGGGLKNASPAIHGSDQIRFSSHAKEVLETKRFVALLREMPDVRLNLLQRDHDYSSPAVFKAVAKKLLSEGF